MLFCGLAGSCDPTGVSFTQHPGTDTVGAFGDRVDMMLCEHLPYPWLDWGGHQHFFFKNVDIAKCRFIRTTLRVLEKLKVGKKRLACIKPFKNR